MLYTTALRDRKCRHSGSRVLRPGLSPAEGAGLAVSLAGESRQLPASPESWKSIPAPTGTAAGTAAAAPGWRRLAFVCGTRTPYHVHRVPLAGRARPARWGCASTPSRTWSMVATAVFGLKSPCIHCLAERRIELRAAGQAARAPERSPPRSAAAGRGRAERGRTRAGTPLSLARATLRPGYRGARTAAERHVRAVARTCATWHSGAAGRARGGSPEGGRWPASSRTTRSSGTCRSAALVSRDGSVDWLCVPRFDSAACLAALLGDEHNGHWRICPTAVEGPALPARRGPLAVPGRLADPADRVADDERHRPGHRLHAAARDAAPVLVRIVEGVQGAVEMESVLRLRFDYGKVVPWVRGIDHAIAAVAGPGLGLAAHPGPADRPRTWRTRRASRSGPASGSRSCCPGIPRTWAAARGRRRRGAGGHQEVLDRLGRPAAPTTASTGTPWSGR